MGLLGLQNIWPTKKRAYSFLAQFVVRQLVWIKLVYGNSCVYGRLILTKDEFSYYSKCWVVLPRTKMNFDGETFIYMSAHVKNTKNINLGINTYLVPKLFRKVQCGTRTLGMFNLVPQFSKEVQFGPLR